MLLAVSVQPQAAPGGVALAYFVYGIGVARLAAPYASVRSWNSSRNSRYADGAGEGQPGSVFGTMIACQLVGPPSNRLPKRLLSIGLRQSEHCGSSTSPA